MSDAAYVKLPGVIPGGAHHAGRLLLLLVFCLALILFLLMRWQPESWLRGQIDEAGRANGLQIVYQKLDLDGLTVHLQQLSLSGGGLPVPVKLEQLTIAPAWGEWLHLRSSIRLQMRSQGMQLSMLLNSQGQLLAFHDVKFESDVAHIVASSGYSLPVQLAGTLLISGDLLYDRNLQRPVGGKLIADLQQAAASFSGKPEALGSATLSVENLDAAGPWHWLLNSGEGLIATGKGSLAMPAAAPALWQLDGRLDVRAGDSLPASFKVFLSQPMHFNVAGSLATLNLIPVGK